MFVEGFKIGNGFLANVRGLVDDQHSSTHNHTTLVLGVTLCACVKRNATGNEQKLHRLISSTRSKQRKKPLQTAMNGLQYNK